MLLRNTDSLQELLMMPLNGGGIYRKQYDGWTISWESNGDYRHWCYQLFDDEWPNLLIIMFNPGSLNNDGSSLNQDTTLRILRKTGKLSNHNIFVINLFDHAETNPRFIFDNWDSKDSSDLIYGKIPPEYFNQYIHAYGNFDYYLRSSSANKEKYEDLSTNTLKRMKLVDSYFRGVYQIQGLTNINGTPKHPISWQREKKIDDIVALLKVDPPFTLHVNKRKRADKWIKHYVSVYREPTKIKLANFDVNWELYSGRFELYFDDVKVEVKLTLDCGMSGKMYYSYPYAYSSLCSYSPVDFSNKTSEAIYNALNDIFPPLKPLGMNQKTGIITTCQTSIYERQDECAVNKLKKKLTDNYFYSALL